MTVFPLGPGARLISVPDDRFQTVRVSAHFAVPLGGNAAENAIVPRLLARGCAEYPDFTRFSRKLAMLYGASVYGASQTVGETQVLTVALATIDDRFAPDGEPVFAEGMRLLCAMLFDPALENGAFRAEDVAEEKRGLAEEIRAEFNDKRAYALHRCRAEMCRGEPYGLDRQGTAAQAEAITPAAATAAWRQLCRTGALTVIAVGRFDADAVAAPLRAALAQMPRDPVALHPAVRRAAPDAMKSVTERTGAQQTKLVLGFRTPCAEPYEDTMPMRMAAVAFGATPVSRLFRNVREKQGLCYYCTAHYDFNKGVMLVDCGVDEARAHAARAEILRQFDRMQADGLTDEELENARRAVLDSVGSVSDSPAMLAGWYLSQLPNDCLRTPEEATARVRAVTAEKCAAAFASLRPAICYQLSGPECAKEADE